MNNMPTQNEAPPASSPTVPAQPVEWKEVLVFVQNQNKSDRDYFDRLFSRTMWAVGIILTAALAVVAFFGVRSYRELKDEMRRQTEDEVRSMRAEVRREIDRQFAAPQIANVIRAVAKERAAGEINKVVRGEVTQSVESAVRQQEPAIRRAIAAETEVRLRNLSSLIEATVANQTRERVERALQPLQAKVAATTEVIRATTLAATAVNGSRAAYAQLKSLASSTSNQDVREVGAWAIQAVEDEHLSALVPGRLNPQLGHEGLVAMASQPWPTLRQKAAEEMGFSKNRRYLPMVVKLIEDTNLRVSRAAIQAFVNLTGQTMQGDHEQNVQAAKRWWDQHKAEFKQ